jgi:hypothetical protein
LEGFRIRGENRCTRKPEAQIPLRQPHDQPSSIWRQTCLGKAVNAYPSLSRRLHTTGQLLQRGRSLQQRFLDFSTRPYFAFARAMDCRARCEGAVAGPAARAAGIAMAFKLIEAAQTRWRAVNAPHLVALVRAGALFRNGALVERPEQDAA